MEDIDPVGCAWAVFISFIIFIVVVAVLVFGFLLLNAPKDGELLEEGTYVEQVNE